MWQIINLFICSFIATLCFVWFTKIVLNKSLEIKILKLLLYLTAITIIQIIIHLIFDNTTKTLGMWIINILLCTQLFKIRIKKSVIITSIYTILLIINELIITLLITKVFKMNREFFYNNYAGSIISNIITCGIFLIMIYFIKNILRRIINKELGNNIKIIIYLFLISVCVLMLFYTLITEFRFSDHALIYLTAITVLLIVLSSLIKQTIENNKLTNEYDKLLEFMTTYENEIEKQRIQRHETKNEFLTIKGKIQDKQNNKEIIDYIDEILTEKIEVKQEEYAKFGYLPANGIKGLCYLKIQEAQDKGISTSINISKRIKNSSIYKLNIKEQRNLGKILGVILDNAIEASVESEDKNMGIEAYLIKGECQIIISNSYSNDNLNIISDNKLSHKGKNRGHGLLLVKSILNSNKLFGLETDITDKLYIQKITIKKVNS